MTQILVHRVPVCAHWNVTDQRIAIERHREVVQSRLPGFLHIFLPDDGSGRGGVTSIDDRRSKIQMKVSRKKAWQRKRMGL